MRKKSLCIIILAGLVSWNVLYWMYLGFEHFTNDVTAFNITTKSLLSIQYASYSTWNWTSINTKSVVCSSSNINFVQCTHKGIVVNVSATLDCAIWIFNQALLHLRIPHLRLQHNKGPDHYFVWAVSRANGRPSKTPNAYFYTLTQCPQVTTLLLSWHSFNEKMWGEVALPVKEYFVKKMPQYSCSMDNLPKECPLQVNQVFTGGHALPDGPHNRVDPSGKNYTLPGAGEFSICLHMVHNALIDTNGNVASGNLDIVPNQCFGYKTNRQYFLSIITPFIPYSKHKEVFIISQNLGHDVYHSLIENLPRLAPYLDFLQNNPHIKIHTARPSLDHFAVLGIKKSRLITGAILADIAYVPNGNGCGWISPIPVQILYQTYQSYIKKHLSLQMNRNRIVLIRRTTGHHRFLAQYEDILALLESFGQKYGLTVEIFRDDPVPSIHQTMAMFHQAIMVVAAHGAGLTNTMFCQHKTVVVEILCSPGPNMCYKSLSHILGFVHVGLLSTKPLKCGPLFVDITYFSHVMKTLLLQILAENTVQM